MIDKNTNTDAASEKEKESVLTHSDSEPESYSEFYHELLGWKKKFEKLRGFWRTRKLISSGEPLYNYSAGKIKELGALGPLTFNVYQSMLSALPTVLIVSWLEFKGTLAVDTSSIRSEELVEYINSVPTVYKFIQPFIVPTIFLAASWVLSWASLRVKEPSLLTFSDEEGFSAIKARKRARNAYLYFDGNYGLYSQAILTLTYTLLSSFREVGWRSKQLSGIPPFLVWSMLAFFYLSLLYQLYLVFREIPRSLFYANGYINNAPWIKYILSVVFFVGPLGWIISYIAIGIALILTVPYVLVKLLLKG